MRLSDLSKGQQARLLSLDKIKDPSVCQRMIELGFIEGQLVQLYKEFLAGGPHLYQVGGTVYALDHALASLVDVQVLNEK